MRDRLERLSARVDAFWDIDGWPARVMVLLFLLAWGGGLTLAGFSVPAERAAAAGVWVAVVLIAATAQVYRHRHGGLLFDSPEARAAHMEKYGSTGSNWYYASLLLTVGAGVAAGAGTSALYAVFGATILSYTPLLTYSGFVRRAEARRGEDV